MTTHHETFYFKDGNVEIVCGSTIFRVHSTIISFSSPKLRDILSRSALFHALTSEGPPCIVIADSAVDFTALLKMIYTPGWVSPIPYAGWALERTEGEFAEILRSKFGIADVKGSFRWLCGLRMRYASRLTHPSLL
jgi:hypothetical protein